MSKKLYPETDIQNIANAIRNLNGSSDTYTVSEMASAIELPENGYYLKESASANPLSITDGEELNAQSCEVSFEPIQDLNGQSAPYPDGGGKNLVDIADRTITSQTTLASNISLEAGTYTLSAHAKNNTSIAGRLKCALTGSSDILTIYIPDGTDGKVYGSFTLTENRNISIIGAGASAGYNFTLSEIQLERGETATDFAPYSNICPISGWDSVDLGVSGKNLFDKSTILSGYKLRNNGSVTESSAYFVSDYIPIVSLDYIAENIVGSGQGYGLWTYDENKTAIRNLTPAGQTPLNKTFTAQDNEKYIRICGKLDYLNSVQVEFGSTATTYEAFRGLTTHTATFPNTVYGGKLDFVSGVLTVTHEYKNMGNYEWNYNATNHVFWINKSDAKLSNNIICDSFAPTTSTSNISGWNDKPNSTIGMMSGTTPYRLCVKDSRYTDASLFKTAMDGVYVCYELATPIEITLTPSQIALLENNNVLWSDSNGNVKLKYFSKSLT